MTAFGLAIFAVISAISIAWAIGKLTAPIGQKQAITSSAIEALMAGPIAAYTYPKQATDEMSDDVNPQDEGDIRTALAVQKERLDGMTKTIEREFARMAEALGKHADAVNNAFSAMKNDLVTKSTFDALEQRFARVERMLFWAVGIVMTSFIGGVIALVWRVK